MTVSDEKTPLLSHVVLVVPGETVTVSAVPAEAIIATAAISSDPWSGLTNRELIILAQEPFWVRLRTITFWAFWVCWMTLFVAAMAVVFTSPRCPDVSCTNSTLVPEMPTSLPTTVTLEAWTTMTVPR